MFGSKKKRIAEQHKALDAFEAGSNAIAQKIAGLDAEYQRAENLADVAERYMALHKLSKSVKFQLKKDKQDIEDMKKPGALSDLAGQVGAIGFLTSSACSILGVIDIFVSGGVFSMLLAGGLAGVGASFGSVYMVVSHEQKLVKRAEAVAKARLELFERMEKLTETLADKMERIPENHAEAFASSPSFSKALKACPELKEAFECVALRKKLLGEEPVDFTGPGSLEKIRRKNPPSA